MGAGAHCVFKKGLEKKDVKKVFRVLIRMANSKDKDKDKEIGQGLGWTAKTTARFHSDLLEYFIEAKQNKKTVDNWFRKRIEIGLERHRIS